MKTQKGLIIGTDDQNNKLQQKDKTMAGHVPSTHCPG